MKLFKSSTFHFLLGVMLVGLGGVYMGQITFLIWYNSALNSAMVYVAKEIAVYASTAYRERGFSEDEE